MHELTIWKFYFEMTENDFIEYRTSLNQNANFILNSFSYLVWFKDCLLPIISTSNLIIFIKR